MIWLLLTQTLSKRIFTAPAPNLSMNGFPPIDQPPVPNPQFLTRYDFSRVPNITVSTPRNNAGVPSCSQNAAVEGVQGRCSWTCGQNCVRPNDVVTCPARGQWALSFDDGPAPYTNALLDYLSARDIRVTFFVVGSRVKEYPQVLLRIFQEGHQIGIHTWSHRALTTQTTEEIISELEYSALAIEQITGTRPLYVRPPFGDFGTFYLMIDDRVRAICEAMNLRPVVWDYDSRDYLLFQNPNSFPNNEIENAHGAKAASQASLSSGVISLHHDLYQLAAQRTPGMIDQIIRNGMNPMPVSECINSRQVYTNANLQIPKSRSLQQSGAVGLGVTFWFFVLLLF